MKDAVKTLVIEYVEYHIFRALKGTIHNAETKLIPKLSFKPNKKLWSDGNVIAVSYFH